MKFTADLHIHSHYSRATSKNLNFFHLAKWAQLKGVDLLATGDISHPGWLAEMKENLVPATEREEDKVGLYTLKDELAHAVAEEVPAACRKPVYFMLGGEISSIYKKNGRVRKVHNMIYAPSLDVVEKIQAALEKIGNIRSDGRPILGLPSRDLLEIILEIDPQNYLIPAHIWTPWFSLLGSKSGYDTVEECFEDLSRHIFAVESGLSSDPPMNDLVSMLDEYTLVSHSDAHSPQKLAREADIFTCELSYSGLLDALKTGDPEKFWGTLEFFPEEGKYHYDGHRKCELCWHPRETIAHGGLCSVCGKKVTVGVMHRVQELADREAPPPQARRRYQNLIPLPEMLSEIHGVGPASKRVQRTLLELLQSAGSELSILLDLPLETVARHGGDVLAEGIRRMRGGQVQVQSGYDGEYGVITVFGHEELTGSEAQLDLFGSSSLHEEPSQVHRARLVPAIDSTKTEQVAGEAETASEREPPQSTTSKSANGGEQNPYGLNQRQWEAVQSTDGPLLIVAGPGTGKTRTLTVRIAHLISELNADPASILAITFTNKATGEMRERLRHLLTANEARRVTVSTFHGLGAQLLRGGADASNVSANFVIAGEDDRRQLFKEVAAELSERERNRVLDAISRAKNLLLRPCDLNADTTALDLDRELYLRYAEALRVNGMLDYDDLILQTVKWLENDPQQLKALRQRYLWISVDEYQDVNFAQYRLLQLLAGAGKRLCAIGDPDQAIYGFRGADRTYFLRFEDDFPGAKRIELEQNYRSTQMILDASQQVINREADRTAIQIWSQFVEQTRLDRYQAPTDRAEAEYVVHQIEQMVGGTSYFSLDSGRVDEDLDANARTFGDFAILVRLAAQMPPLVEALERSGIPYQAVGRTPLLEEKEIQEILAYLWLLANPDSQFLRDKIEKRLQAPLLIEPFIQDLCQRKGELSVQELIETVDAFILEQHPDRERRTRREHVQRFSRLGIPFQDRLLDFLENVALQKDADLYDARADRVTLMTLHSSKGLEFPVVFIVGCEESILPHQFGDRAVDVAEERRLFYVGMTRAQQKLILTNAQRRMLFGAYVQNAPSRFINDIEQSLTELKKANPPKPKAARSEAVQLGLFDM